MAGSIKAADGPGRDSVGRVPRRLGELVMRPCHQANRAPGTGQADRDSPADAAPGPGHQRRLAVQ